ncbi:glycosyltransferase family 9 protein [soil metagenome]
MTITSMASRPKAPRTVVLHQFVGIGDLVWHIPYFRAVARQSEEGRVAVIASPTTFARDLLQGEEWVSEVIDFDRRPRRSERRQGRHSGLIGVFRMARELRGLGFERIVLFSTHPNRGLLAWLARIPERLGYGSNPLQRVFLNAPPYIAPYRGSSVSVFNDAASFAIAHGFCEARIVPKLRRPDAAVLALEPQLAHLPRPLYSFAIGTSEPFKQWGAVCFAALASELIERGCGVLLLGGPAEDDVAREIVEQMPAGLRHAVRVQTRGSITDTVAALWLSDACVGNDTGVTNLAVACDKPTFALLGPRPLLDLDPLMTMIRAPRLTDIDCAAVVRELALHCAPGFAAH